MHIVQQHSYKLESKAKDRDRSIEAPQTQARLKLLGLKKIS